MIIQAGDWIDKHPDEWPHLLALFCMIGGLPENWRAVAIEVPPINTNTNHDAKI